MAGNSDNNQSGSNRREDPIFFISQRFVSVIVPVFNEASHIVDNIDLLISEIEDHFADFEILIVSDGSKDGTNFRVFQFKHPNIRLVIQGQNQGKGAAIRRGFSEAKGDYVFFIDGGMELHPKELHVFLGLMRLYEADIILGSKRHPQSKVYYPWYRRFLSAIYQRMIRYLFNVNVTDTQVGMKLFRGEVVKAVLPDLTIDRYGFDLEILSLAQAKGFTNFLEAPIQLDYFMNQKRFILTDLWHVLKVGRSLMMDMIRLYFRLRRLKARSSAAAVSESVQRG